MMENAHTDEVSLVADHRDTDDAGTASPETAPTDHAGAPIAPLKYINFDDQPGSTHNLVVGLVPRGARVLEIGCATGYMSEVLRDRLGCTVVGVEIDPAAAGEAAGRAERVLVGDAESLDWEQVLPGERFDVVLFADVLEHLSDPGAVLGRMKALLAEGGAVVASVPNVAHASVRLALLGGEFTYRETGLLDATHLRFFTRRSLEDLFEARGFAIANWLRKRRTLEESEVSVPRAAYDERALAVATGDDEATTYQFVVRAVPAEHATMLAVQRSAADERERTLESSLRKAAGALAERDAALDAALRDISDMRVRLVDEERAGRDRGEAVDRLEQEVELLSTVQAELAAELARAHEALELGALGRARQELKHRYPALARAYRSLRHRNG